MTDSKSQCKGTTQAGDRCQRQSHADYCYMHEHQAPDAEPGDGLNDKQRLFVELYLANGLNAAKAYRDAGYCGNDRSAPYVLKNDDRVKALIEKRLEEHAMGSAEALARLTEWGRGTFEFFLDDEGRLDLESEQAQHNRHLIKKIHYDDYGRPERIELHDPKDATKSIAKIHGLVKDRVEHSGSVEHTEAPRYDYSVLSDDELEELERITAKLEETVDDSTATHRSQGGAGEA